MKNSYQKDTIKRKNGSKDCENAKSNSISYDRDDWMQRGIKQIYQQNNEIYHLIPYGSNGNQTNKKSKNRKGDITPL